MFKAISSTFLICIVLMGSAGISLVERVLASEQVESCCITEANPCCADTNEVSGCCEDEVINLHVKFDFAQNHKALKICPNIFDLATTKVKWTNQFHKLEQGGSEAVYHIYPPPLFKTGTQLILENQEFLI